ncbi:MAG: hypothetical protein ACRDR6_26505 [Pseudonocardiaceae bacterium]
MRSRSSNDGFGAVSVCRPGCSGQGHTPREVRWDLADPARRRDLYEIVLGEGTVDDVRELINGN